VTARAYPILVDDKMSEEEDTKEVKRKRTADRHSKEYSDKRKVENKEKTRPVLGALVSRKLAYLMKDWSMDTADQVLLEVMAQYPDPDKRKKRVKLEPSKPLKVDMKEEEIDINPALYDDILVRRIQHEANLSDEKLPIILALAAMRGREGIDEKGFDDILKRTPMQTANKEHSRFLHLSDIEVLKAQLKAIAKVHFSVDLSTRDSHAHMQLLVSFWDKDRSVSFAVIFYL
jgi:hypothetical protein